MTSPVHGWLFGADVGAACAHGDGLNCTAHDGGATLPACGADAGCPDGGSRSPVLAALLALLVPGGVEYCYLSFWGLCAAKTMLGLLVICTAVLRRCGSLSSTPAWASAALAGLGFVLVAWDVLNAVSLLDGGFALEHCGRRLRAVDWSWAGLAAGGGDTC